MIKIFKSYIYIYIGLATVSNDRKTRNVLVYWKQEVVSEWPRLSTSLSHSFKTFLFSSLADLLIVNELFKF